MKAIKTSALAESVYYILLRLHQPAHGYALMKDISKLTNNRVNLGPGTVYGALDTLQRKKWIKAVESNQSDRKNEYVITDLGKKFFQLELNRLEELLKNAKEMKEKNYENQN